MAWSVRAVTSSCLSRGTKPGIKYADAPIAACDRRSASTNERTSSPGTSIGRVGAYGAFVIDSIENVAGSRYRHADES